MSERRHGLEAHLSGRNDSATLSLELRPELGHINLRGSSDAFVTAVEAVLGQSLPVAPNTTSAGDHQVYWLGPDEYHVVTDLASAGRLLSELQSALEGVHAAINDQSGGFVAMRLQGESVVEMLSKGTTLDLHPSVLSHGQCAQSGLAKAAALMAPLADHAGFDLIVRRSFSDYLLLWLKDAAREQTLSIFESN